MERYRHTHTVGQGVRVGDKIAEFGSVTAANFSGLKNVADIVQHSVGVSQLTHTRNIFFIIVCVCVCVLYIEAGACTAGKKRRGSLSLPHSSDMAWTRPLGVSQLHYTYIYFIC